MEKEYQQAVIIRKNQNDQIKERLAQLEAKLAKTEDPETQEKLKKEIALLKEKLKK